MIKVGDRVRIIGGDLFLGKWLPVGTEGIVVGDVISLEQYLYLIEIEDEIYNLAPAEFEVIFSMEHSIVTDDDGYPD